MSAAAAPADWGDWFLTADPVSHERLREQAAAVAAAVARARGCDRPFSGVDPDALAATLAALDPCPPEGVALDAVLDEVQRLVLANAVHVSDPRCAAHLHCPTLLPAAVTELAIGATNQSMDSFDQAPAATLVEDHLVRWLAATLRLPGGSGVLTGGGTASNLLGLLLARERAVQAVRPDDDDLGLPPESRRWRILASEAAHDSIVRGARVLGLGGGAVVAVATDATGRMDVGALDAALGRLAADGLRPIAIVATAGTTDLGAIDPLPELARRARAHGAWLHVDAAVGSAFALSPRLAPWLDGIEHADSITADLHKLWFQPIGASALLVPDVRALEAVRHHSDYLNRADDEADGVLNLVGRSLDTSRRFDALKVLVGLRSAGRDRLAAMIEHVVALAQRTGAAVQAHDELELLAPVATIAVVLRWRPAAGGLDDAAVDAANVAAQRALLRSGAAIVGRTRLHGRVALKLTCINPMASEADTRGLLDLIAAAGREAAGA